MRVNLKVLRVKNKLSQSEMSERLNIKRPTYGNIENGIVYGNIPFWNKVQKEFNISDEDMWKLIKDE